MKLRVVGTRYEQTARSSNGRHVARGTYLLLRMKIVVLEERQKLGHVDLRMCLRDAAASCSAVGPMGVGAAVM